jgi:hypothetical protein
MPELGQWDSFYVIVGSAAGALIGLQFVVMTLIANRPQTGSPEAGAAFASPTVIHFSTVLLLSAMLRAPWHSFMAVATFWGLVGVCGVVYTGVVIRRMRTQQSYDPVFEDWLFHALLPLLAYLALALSLFAAPARAHAALFAVGAATLLLLFVGIHNSWDAVAYHVFVNLRKAKD